MIYLNVFLQFIYQLGSVWIRNSFPLRVNSISILQFLEMVEMENSCVCCIKFTRWGKTDDARLLFTGLEWTKFASREKSFLSHRNMHWSDCLWVVCSMYSYFYFHLSVNSYCNTFIMRKSRTGSSSLGLLTMNWSLHTKSFSCFSPWSPHEC